MTVTIDRKAKTDQLLDFLARYVLAHPNHPTPSVDLMAREIGLDTNQTNLLLIRLEDEGLIHIVSRKPLRIMLRDNGGVINPTASPDRYERFLSADAQRHSLGRFIGEHEALSGRGPTLREMANHLNVSNHSWVWNAATMLAKKGIITFGEGIPTKLTEQGRRLYGFKPQPETKVVIVHRKEKKVTAKKMPAFERVDALGKFIYDYQETHYGHAPSMGAMALGIGLNENNNSSVSAVLEVMIANGLIERRKRLSSQPFVFTEKGLKKFGPQETDERPRLANEVEQSHVEYVEPYPEPQTFPSPPSSPSVTIPDVTAADLVTADTADLILELIDRGYIVKKGG